MNARAEALIAEMARRGLRLATAESCTGGMIIAALTDVPGASAVVDCGFITYANSAKTSMLSVPPAMIEQFGAVSREVACAMASGALTHAQADIAIAVTGVAGPSGGSAAKPVGLVHLACARRGNHVLHEEHRFQDNGRNAIRQATVEAALLLIERVLASP